MVRHIPCGVFVNESERIACERIRVMIVQGGNIILTDYDTFAQSGESARGGTLPYASPDVQSRTAIHPRDDVYSMAASLFDGLTDRGPFAYGAQYRKELGLNWEGVEGLEGLRAFFDRATHPDADHRFSDAIAAAQFLADQESEQIASSADTASTATGGAAPLTPNHVPWLRHLLSSYPGSHQGNSETLGLDSPFAEATYVETRLDDNLLHEIEAGEINLVILFGNAGDGKTAFFQHLAQRLGLSDVHSSKRVWETRLGDGKRLKVNLDGAVAWEGKNANSLLDDLFRPFHNQDFSPKRIFFDIYDCAELHADPDLRPPRYWQRAFDARSSQRQGELLTEMARFDPALEADPILDRQLLREPPLDRAESRLAQARRRAWFTRRTGGSGGDIRLAGGRHLGRFRSLPTMPPSEAAALLRDLCLGIARLEDLPPQAFAPKQLSKGVPLRITPRTPTESAFWVIKPWENFDLQAALPSAAEGLETLHTHLQLIYRYQDGSRETLMLGLELFHLLLDLKDGVQLSGVAQEGVFANLEIFTQRLAREDSRTLHGWHPSDEDQVFRIRIVPRDGRQVLLREMV